MGLVSSDNIYIAGGATRMGLASNIQSTTSGNSDYHLPWTGEVVQETLQKAMDIDLSGIGGIKTVESDATHPANPNELMEKGSYTINYVDDSDFPDDVKGISPVQMYIYEQDGILMQLLEAGGNSYIRWFDESTGLWSVWSPKTDNGKIDTSDPSVPAEDPIQELDERVTILENATVEADVKWGSVEDAQKMIAGTYDYDA